MKGFKIDGNGDVLIKNGYIEMVDGIQLLRQTVERVLGTNKGEWFLNKNEGINFDYLIGKNVSKELIRSEILGGLKQVNSSYELLDFSYDIDKEKRTLSIRFRAKSDDGDIVEG